MTNNIKNKNKKTAEISPKKVLKKDLWSNTLKIQNSSSGRGFSGWQLQALVQKADGQLSQEPIQWAYQLGWMNSQLLISQRRLNTGQISICKDVASSLFSRSNIVPYTLS